MIKLQMLRKSFNSRSNRSFHCHSLLIFFVFLQYGLQAQQLPQYTQFSLNPYLFNPALAGTEDFVHIQANIRSQWTGFKGAPQTAFLSGHTTLNKETIGYGTHKKFARERWRSVGGIFIIDKAGPISQTAAYGTFAYNIPMSANGLRFSFGANAGLKSFAYNPDGFLANLSSTNDPVIQTAYTSMVFDIDFGFWMYSRKFFMGASAFHLLNNDITNTTLAVINTPSSGSNLARHYFAMAGYKINIHKDLFVVPSVLVKLVQPALPSYDINFKTVYRNEYWFGAAYRSGDSFSAFIGLLINKKLELSYSYDLITSSLRQSSIGSNEILVGYRFSHKPKTICPDKFW
jgi:type IX secretion system PorP/SprF family membrane protein